MRQGQQIDSMEDTSLDTFLESTGEAQLFPQFRGVY
tara:strand:- start:246 stop:353 length:108 start_codon:yes stop_codon:yes gene_type:complete